MNIFIVCFLAIQETASLVCQNDQFVIKSPNNDLFCVDCPMCPPGFGVTIPCGSSVPVSYNVSVACKPCVAGEYSDSLSSERCKPCSNCLPDELVVTSCSDISDTCCSSTRCPKGYYRNETVLKCLPCSECCGLDEVIPQCVGQNIPRTQTCGYQKRNSCGSECWFDEVTVVGRDGNQTCQPCPVCSKESGLTVPCGSVVREEVFVGCERPNLGKTFVNQQGVLQSCSICSLGQVVIDNCSSNCDTKCGGCKQGFYFDYHSKTCQECFSCCKYIDSDNITKCIRKGVFLAERNDVYQARQPFLQRHSQSVQAHQDSHLVSLLKLLKMGLILGLILIAFDFVLQRRKDSRSKIHNVDVPSLDRVERLPLMQVPRSHITVEATQETRIGTEEVDPEYLVRQAPGHVVFEKTGVEVISLGSQKHLPPDLRLQATSNSAMIGFLEEGEIALSPTISFVLATKLGMLSEVHIPHGANVILSHTDWIISLRELRNKRWVDARERRTGERGITKFVIKSNHVSFETDHLATFAIVGKLTNNALSAFKRMKVAAFCSETNIGQVLLVRLYCFDDCEYSFEWLMRKEKEEGGKLISSIESLDFSVGSKKDVEITVMDTEGWQLHQASPTKFGYNLLRSSFDNIPQCDLVFRPVVPGKSSFFVVLALTHEPSSDSKTVVYASTAIKNKEFPEDFGEKMKANQPVERKQVGNEKCIIQM